MHRILKEVASRQGLGYLTTREDEAQVEGLERAYESLRGVLDAAKGS